MAWFVEGMLAGLAGREIVDWAKGFALGVGILEVDWSRSEFTADDWLALSMLAVVAEGEPPGRGVRKHLAGFIGRRAALRDKAGA